MQGEVLVEARGVSCRCGAGDKMALIEASVSLKSGQIHALVGENGAGKSTLLKLMAGAMPLAGGEVLVGGSPLRPATTAEAIRRGVGMVYQHFALVGSFTGEENLMLGVEPVGPLGWLRPAALRQRAREVAEQTGLRVPMDVPVERLSVGERQRLEILRVLVRGARTLLLDEPTAVLTPTEAAGLYELLRRVATSGAAIAVVTHQLDDVVRHADEVTVLRRGVQVFQKSVAGVTTRELAERALGEIAPVTPPAAVSADSPALLGVEALSTEGDGVALREVSLRVRRGEVLGIAGIDGNGQEALVEAIAGLRPVSAGRIVIDGRELTHAPVAERRGAGVEVVHGDRHRFGLLSGSSIHDNLLLGDLGPDEASLVQRRMGASGVTPPDPTMLAGALSGGNQQKVVMARALDRHPRVLVAAYPTRGIDAAAAALVQQRLVSAASEGAAVLLVSGDWAELRAVAHRLIVLSRGRVAAELPGGASEQELGKAMLEGSHE